MIKKKLHNCKKHFLLISVLSLCTIYQNLFAQEKQDSDSIAVVKTVNDFVDAFSNLKWDKFTGFFADDATAFFPPSANFPNRANNKIEIENIFSKVFEHARQQKSSPPYLTIKPQELKIQMLNDVAIITFELNDTGMFGRRTIILQKRKDNWLIIHLHASGIATDSLKTTH